MIEQMDASKYKESWHKAARKSIISGFRAWGWGSRESVSRESKELEKSDFIDVPKKTASPVDTSKSASQSIPKRA